MLCSRYEYAQFQPVRAVLSAFLFMPPLRMNRSYADPSTAPGSRHQKDAQLTMVKKP